MAVARRMWNLAIRWELTTTNPFTRIEPYREKARERTAKTSELEAIGRAMAELALPDPVRRCIILLATTGCRSGEARRLRWEDTTLDAGVALLRDTKNHERPPPGAQRRRRRGFGPGAARLGLGLPFDLR